MSSLSIEVNQISATIAEVKVVGDLDANSYENMEKKFEDLFGNGCYQLVCNLEGVEYISSAGAGVFLGAVDTAEENNGNIVLLRPSSGVQEVFDILGLMDIMPCAQTIDEAVKIFQN